MSADKKLLVTLKSGVVVFAAVAAALVITKDFMIKKAPAVDANAAAGTYPYSLTTIYDKCGHTVVTKGEKKENTGDESVHVDNYCPYHFRFYEKDGLIAVSRMDNLTAAPLAVLEVQVSTLPYNDRQSLKKGIEVYGEERMQQLIEDFES